MSTEDKLLSPTQIRNQLGEYGQLLEPWDINHILEKMGWIYRHANHAGWGRETPAIHFGAETHETYAGKRKKTYVKWPRTILTNQEFLQATANYLLEITDEKTLNAVKGEGGKTFVEKYADGATIRTEDGHQVRSRAEKIIDNWFYRKGVIHAFEAPLFLKGRDKPLMPDWTLDYGKVYVEFVGMLDKAEYKKHWEWKQGLYTQHQIPLIVILPADIETGLEYVLPPKLREFGVDFK